MNFLPELHAETLSPTRDHLRNAALVLGSLQRAFVPEHPRNWHHGLEVNMRGLVTQALTINGAEVRGSIDLVQHKVRLGGTNWQLEECDGPELFKNVRAWLESQNITAELEEPEYAKTNTYDAVLANDYAEALWWLDKRLQSTKETIKEGVTSPILLYPHHFDLSLVWFPWNDERQLGLGWSTGDENIPESYVYLTAYPEPAGFTSLPLGGGAFWQADGFSGAVLPYEVLGSSDNPDGLLDNFVSGLFQKGRGLLN